MSGWNFADAWEAVAQESTLGECQVQGNRRVTWPMFDRRANGVARTLLDLGLTEQDKVAQYLQNGPEYLESVFAAFKAGLVPVNTNYRYLDDELVYLWDDSDAAAVVFHGTFAERVEQVRRRTPRVKCWLFVADESGATCPEWAVPYEDAAAAGAAEPTVAPWGRSGDQLLLLYTGGTTGLPKGVMWRQDDLFRHFCGGLEPRLGQRPADYDYLRRLLPTPRLVSLPTCPLMHGSGWFTQLIVLAGGGTTVTLVDRSLNASEILSTIEREGVNQLVIVGDAFARTILDALQAQPGRHDLASLSMIVSGGAMFSESAKAQLLAALPHSMIMDMLGSSEAPGMGQSVSTSATASGTAKFMPNITTKVVTEDGRLAVPGSGEIGRVLDGGIQPLGYYKDQAKTDATFIMFEGQRYSCPGDWATVEADGSLTLLGRGSVCINTGGEKVFPEEVEEALKLHTAVRDAVVVGVPDTRFGEAITGVVELEAGATVEATELVTHVKGLLAGYKAPKHIVIVDSIGRAPNGKVDYQQARSEAQAILS